jgi:hypothetical protein
VGRVPHFLEKSDVGRTLRWLCASRILSGKQIADFVVGCL